MSIALSKLDRQLVFPDVEQALQEPDGLLAFGGDLSPERLTLSYQSGIFPWFSHNEPIMWWSPSERGILELNEFHCSKSLKKLIRNHSYQITLNNAFEQVIDACATIPRNDSGTWITETMISAYKQLHYAGQAHSIEVWQQQKLVGGLYGVVVGKIFCGESMFHRQPNCSKLAMYWLVTYLQQHQFELIDCQLVNPHLTTMGVKGIARQDFIKRLQQSVAAHSSYQDDLWESKVLNG